MGAMQVKNKAILNDGVLDVDLDAEVRRIAERMRHLVSRALHKRGFIIAMSGGIDSSVCAALAVEAVGSKKVFGLLLPEQDSSSASTSRGELLAHHLGIGYQMQDIAPTLREIGCYRWRDEAIRATFPDYAEGWKNKIAISTAGDGRFNYFRLVVQSPDGKQQEKRLDLPQYLQIVAATNYKQRIRKAIEYFHADRLNYAVIGTPNLLEYDQGFFVKNGDGSADIKPIAHLYKTQVYALARHMGLPDEICSSTPTTDTYSLPQGQDEFYFSLPYGKMDIALWAFNHSVSPEDLARYMSITTEQAERIYADITAKRQTTAYLHSPPLLTGTVSQLPVISG